MARSRLCTACLNIFSKSPSDIGAGGMRKQHHLDTEDFFKAVEESCYICSWTYRNMRWSRSQGYVVHVPVYSTTYTMCIDQLMLRIKIYSSKTEGELRYTADFWGFETRLADQYPNIVRTKLNSSLRSEETFSLIGEWIEECCSGHIDCRGCDDPRTLPTRLIKVQPCVEPQKLVANICHGDTLPPDTPYLTLSHCWGDATFLTLTCTNPSSWETLLPVNELSRTFQDAFFATVNMGFQYIWIDSLCIIQDDLEDWKHEAQLMHHVYRNCTCMISASGFANGDEGFILSERRIDPSVPIIHVPSQYQPSGFSGSQDGLQKSYYLIHSYPWWEFRRGPIFYRGWTLQEQLLAPRAVHFSDDQVYWVCKQTTANEAWPRGWMGTPLEVQFTGSSDRILRLNLGNVVSDCDSLRDDWMRVVQEYSIRRLTFASDRLPALAGIINGFRNQLKDESIYGLWLKDIHRGLMFEQMRDNIGTCVVPTGNDSPTWSWAALHAPVIWDIRLYQHQICKICAIDLLRFPRTLQLRLCGKLMNFPSEYRGLDTKVINVSEFEVRGSDDKGLAIRLRPDHWFIKQNLQWEIMGEIDAPLDMLRRQSLDYLTIMPILCYISWDKKRYVVMGLLLQAQPSAERGVYRRVGIVRLWLNCEEKPTFDTVKRHVAVLQSPLADYLYQEMDGNGNYTITVV